MSLSNHSSPHQNVEPSENKSWPPRLSTPIACRVCDKVFFDNLSLVFHFECHVDDGISLPASLGRDLAFSRSGRHLSLDLNRSPFASSVERMKEARRLVLAARAARNKALRPLSVSSSVTPNAVPTGVNLVEVPVLNSMPPLSSSFNARPKCQNLSQPFPLSTMAHQRATSSSTLPLMYSQVGARSFARGSATVPPLDLRGQNGGQGPHMKQLEKPLPEIIVISDDEEDENKNADEIDLTLKL